MKTRIFMGDILLDKLHDWIKLDKVLNASHSFQVSWKCDGVAWLVAGEGKPES